MNAFSWVATAIAVVILALPRGSLASPEIWLAPPDNIAQPNAIDFQGFVQSPQSWKNSAGHIRVLSITATYLLRAPPSDVQKLLRQIETYRLLLTVSISVLPTDKKRCGDGVEGMVWPHEAGEAAKKLKALGANVDSFSFDLPLTAGVISDAPQACHFSVQEAAALLAQSVRELRAFYPQAKMLDGEVPTGLPVERWSALLTEWLRAYRDETGTELDGFGMDVWYKGAWQEVVRETARILSDRGIPAGVILDASEGPNLSAAEWIDIAKKNTCELESAKIPLKFLVVANWLDLKVPSLPESDANTLTGMVNWISEPRHCDVKREHYGKP
jgi:hypothetical protein